jgi:hypothetical protein
MLIKKPLAEGFNIKRGDLYHLSTSSPVVAVGVLGAAGVCLTGTTTFVLVAATFVLYVVVVVCVEVEIRHQLCFNIIHRLCQRLQELVEVFLVQKDLVPVVTIFVEFLTAFGDSKIVIVTTRSPYIEEIRPALPSSDAFAINAFHPFVVVFVRHNEFFSVENY